MSDEEPPKGALTPGLIKGDLTEYPTLLRKYASGSRDTKYLFSDLSQAANHIEDLEKFMEGALAVFKEIIGCQRLRCLSYASATNPHGGCLGEDGCVCGGEEVDEEIRRLIACGPRCSYFHWNENTCPCNPATPVKKTPPPPKCPDCDGQGIGGHPPDGYYDCETCEPCPYCSWLPKPPHGETHNCPKCGGLGRRRKRRR